MSVKEFINSFAGPDTAKALKKRFSNVYDQDVMFGGNDTLIATELNTIMHRSPNDLITWEQIRDYVKLKFNKL